MLHVIGLIFFICLALLFALLAILAKILGSIFGFGRKVKRTFSGSGSAQAEGSQVMMTERRSSKRKIFEDDEGEYVEYEEVKD